MNPITRALLLAASTLPVSQEESRLFKPKIFDDLIQKEKTTADLERVAKAITKRKRKAVRKP